VSATSTSTVPTREATRTADEEQSLGGGAELAAYPLEVGEDQLLRQVDPLVTSA
jgi:hypothetical protein